MEINKMRLTESCDVTHAYDVCEASLQQEKKELTMLQRESFYQQAKELVEDELSFQIIEEKLQVHVQRALNFGGYLNVVYKFYVSDVNSVTLDNLDSPSDEYHGEDGEVYLIYSNSYTSKKSVDEKVALLEDAVKYPFIVNELTSSNQLAITNTYLDEPLLICLHKENQQGFRYITQHPINAKEYGYEFKHSYDVLDVVMKQRGIELTQKDFTVEKDDVDVRKITGIYEDAEGKSYTFVYFNSAYGRSRGEFYHTADVISSFDQFLERIEEKDKTIQHFKFIADCYETLLRSGYRTNFFSHKGSLRVGIVEIVFGSLGKADFKIGDEVIGHADTVEEILNTIKRLVPRVCVNYSNYSEYANGFYYHANEFNGGYTIYNINTHTRIILRPKFNALCVDIYRIDGEFSLSFPLKGVDDITKFIESDIPRYKDFLFSEEIHNLSIPEIKQRLRVLDDRITYDQIAYKLDFFTCGNKEEIIKQLVDVSDKLFHTYPDTILNLLINFNNDIGLVQFLDMNNFTILWQGQLTLPYVDEENYNALLVELDLD